MIEDFENIGLLEFLNRFKTDIDCSNYIASLRWDGVIECPFCNNPKVYKTKPQSGINQIPSFKCGECGKRFTATTMTIFQGTRVSIRTWFFLLYQLAITKKNNSSYQVARNLDLTQKTSWTLGMKIRYQLAEQHVIKLSGVVEVDEVFVCRGTLGRWTNWGGISTRKAPILGLIERGGKVVIVPIPNRSRQAIHEIIKKHVVPGSKIYTDGWAAYRNLTDLYDHDYVEHSSKEYVRGDVHTNTIENVWSFLKKSIRNAHHSVSEKHIEAYCNEVAFRFNYRNLTFTERFNEILHRCITYKSPINANK